MSRSFALRATIESPYFPEDFSCPWPVFGFNNPGPHIRLSGDMNYGQIGLVIALLAEYNRVNLSDTKQAVLNDILDCTSLILPGGIQAIEGDRVISPGCCCGLEGWQEWQDFSKTGQTPWLGHDPSPWLEQKGDLVRIWSDGGTGESRQKAFSIDVYHSIFCQQLIAVEKDLQAFLFCLDSWVREIGFDRPKELVQRFDLCFKIDKY
jgi:hypothetical protein